MNIIMRFITFIIFLIAPSYAVTDSKNNLVSTKSVLAGYSSDPNSYEQMFYYGYVEGIVFTAFHMNNILEDNFGESIFCLPETLNINNDMLISSVEEVMNYSEEMFKVYEKTTFYVGALQALQWVYPCK